MSRVIEYHKGGFDAAAPRQNVARELDLGAGTVTSWDAKGVLESSRALTADETAALQLAAAKASVLDNDQLVRDRARAALATNATYLAQPAIPANPTLAQLTAATRVIRAQVDALTRQSTALIKLELADLSDTNGT